MACRKVSRAALAALASAGVRVASRREPAASVSPNGLCEARAGGQYGRTGFTIEQLHSGGHDCSDLGHRAHQVLRRHTLSFHRLDRGIDRTAVTRDRSSHLLLLLSCCTGDGPVQLRKDFLCRLLVVHGAGQHVLNDLSARLAHLDGHAGCVRGACSVLADPRRLCSNLLRAVQRPGRKQCQQQQDDGETAEDAATDGEDEQPGCASRHLCGPPPTNLPV